MFWLKQNFIFELQCDECLSLRDVQISVHVKHCAKLEGKWHVRVMCNAVFVTWEDVTLSNVSKSSLVQWFLLPANVESALATIRDKISSLGTYFTSKVSVLRETFSSFMQGNVRQDVSNPSSLPHQCRATWPCREPNSSTPPPHQQCLRGVLCWCVKHSLLPT